MREQIIVIVSIIVIPLAALFLTSENARDYFVHFFISNEKILDDGEQKIARVIDKQQEDKTTSDTIIYPGGPGRAVMIVPMIRKRTSSHVVLEANGETFSFKLNKKEYENIKEGDSVDITMYKGKVYLTERLR